MLEATDASVETSLIETTIHGRVLTRRCPSDPAGTIVGFHGYGENCEASLAELGQLRAVDDWDLIAVNALNRFYTSQGDVVGSWMTREDRKQMISDNRAYVSEVVGKLVRARPLVLVGFSQGVAMAYRAGALGDIAADGVVALAGDLPPDVEEGVQVGYPPVLIARGDAETWYDAEHAARDAATLRRAGVTVQTYEFDGGHEWTDAFRSRLDEFLDSIAARSVEN